MGHIPVASGHAAAAVYDKIAHVYDSTRHLPDWVAHRVAAHIRARLPGTRKARFLEIGVGTGRITSALARGLPVRQVVGLDLSPAMLGVLRTKLGGVQPVLGDASQLPFAASRFDAALSCHVLHMIPDLAGAIAEIQRVLRPGGLYVHCTDELAPHQQEYDQIWQMILATEDAAYLPALRYDMRRDDIVNLWRERGATVDAALVGRWRARHRVGDLLAAYQAKAYPSCHRVAAPAFAAAIARLREETLRVYSTLDRELVSITGMEIVTAHVSEP